MKRQNPYYSFPVSRVPRRRKKTPRILLLILAAAALGAAAFFLLRGCGSDTPAAEVTPVVEEEEIFIPDPIGFERDEYDCVEGKIATGSYFGRLMNTDLGVPMSRVQRLSEADSIFDVRKIRAGNIYRAYYTRDSIPQLRYVVYEENKVSSIVFRCDSLPAVWRYSKPVTLERRAADATIDSSLWNDMQAAGASPLVIIDLSDIYAWTVDFFAIQKGDRFRVLYDELLCDGEVIRIDTVRYAEYIHGESVQTAIMLNQKDTGNVYWSAEGESLKRAFLKAPLEYKRISSTYSMHRKHPVHGDVRPHTGVDYAAPSGTPVVSVGDGTVVSAGWSGGGGNTVKIRHNSVYTTGYMHLSKYGPGIKSGVHVKQGQVIGYVGMTGTATGPHLDYRVWKNGSPINPLTMEAPPAVPIRDENRAALDSARVHYKAEMEALLAAQPVRSPAEDLPAEEAASDQTL